MKMLAIRACESSAPTGRSRTWIRRLSSDRSAESIESWSVSLLRSHMFCLYLQRQRPQTIVSSSCSIKFGCSNPTSRSLCTVQTQPQTFRTRMATPPCTKSRLRWMTQQDADLSLRACITNTAQSMVHRVLTPVWYELSQQHV